MPMRWLDLLIKPLGAMQRAGSAVSSAVILAKDMVVMSNWRGLLWPRPARGTAAKPEWQ